MRLPHIKIADWVVIAASVTLLGASAVIGPNRTNDLQIWLFWAGIGGLILLFVLLVIRTITGSGKDTTKPLLMGIGGTGGSGTIIGGGGTIIGGRGGNVGAGGIGRGGDGGGGTIDARGTGLTLHHALIIGGEGGSVDGTNIWYPPAQSGYIQMLETQGQTPDFNVQYPGAGGATTGWLERQAVVVKIRERFFREHGEEPKIDSSKIGDVPLEYVNAKLQEADYPWRARIENKYWYLFYIPGSII